MQDPSNGWQLSHRKIWILQNFIIISVMKFVNLFIFFDLKYFSNYFCGWLLTFYSFFIYLFFKILLKNKININLSIFISISFSEQVLFLFYRSLHRKFSSFINFLRLNSRIKKKFLFDILLVLIKPYYLIVVICMVYDDFKISRKSILYLFSYLQLF